MATTVCVGSACPALGCSRFVPILLPIPQWTGDHLALWCHQRRLQGTAAYISLLQAAPGADRFCLGAFCSYPSVLPPLPWVEPGIAFTGQMLTVVPFRGCLSLKGSWVACRGGDPSTSRLWGSRGGWISTHSKVPHQCQGGDLLGPPALALALGGVIGPQIFWASPRGVWG